jgi:hypothetical protein
VARSLGAVIFLSVQFFLLLSGQSSVAATGCEGATLPEFVSEEPQTTLEPADNRTKNPPPINFRNSRGVKTLAPYRFNVKSGPFPDLTKLGWDLILVSGNNELPASEASVTFSKVIGALKVTLCVDARGVAPGAYSGGLRIAGAAIEPIEIQLTANLRDNEHIWIAGGLVVATIVALFYKWWLDNVADPGKPDDPNPLRFWSWVKSHWGRVLIAAVGGAGGIYFKDYWNTEAFVPSDRWTLWLAAGTAVVAASVLTGAAGNAIARTRNKPE